MHWSGCQILSRDFTAVSGALFCLNWVILRPFFQVLKYCSSSAINLANLVGSGWSVGSPALDWRSPASARLRACVEAVLTWQLVEAQCSRLEQNKLDRVYAGTIYKYRICLCMTVKFVGTETSLISDIYGLIFCLWRFKILCVSIMCCWWNIK